MSSSTARRRRRERRRPDVTELARATPVYVLGDSHVFGLADRILRASSGELFVFRSLWCPGVRATEFVGPDGELNAHILDALQVGRVLVSYGSTVDASHRTGSPHWRHVLQLEGRLDGEPALVITTGSVDIAEICAHITEPDVVLPDAVLADPAVPAICYENAPGALAADEAARRFDVPADGLRAALRIFRQKGLSRIAVLGLPPMSLDDDACDAGYVSAGFPLVDRASPLGFRYKTVLLVNAALRRMCGEEGVPYVDRWAAFTENGFVRPGILRDYVHLDDAAAGRAAADVIDALHLRPADMPDGTPDAGLASRRAQAELFGGRKLEDPALAAVFALAAARHDARVLDVGPDGGELSYAFAAGGARVTALDDSADRIATVRATAGGLPVRTVLGDPTAFCDPAGYDVAVVTSLLDGLSADRRAQLFGNLALTLGPEGSLIVHTAVRRDEDRSPDALRWQLQGAFDHVVVWVAARDDQRGSLGRPFTAPELRSATDVFAVASNARIDPSEVLRRLTTPPLASDDDFAVTLSQLAAPKRVRADHAFTADVTLRNDGGALLSGFAPHPVQFAYAWSDANGSAAGEGRSRIEPAADPGSSGRYAVGVLAPPEPGRYGLRVSVVQEGRRWFDATAEITLQVG